MGNVNQMRVNQGQTQISFSPPCNLSEFEKFDFHNFFSFEQSACEKNHIPNKKF